MVKYIIERDDGGTLIKFSKEFNTYGQDDGSLFCIKRAIRFRDIFGQLQITFLSNMGTIKYKMTFVLNFMMVSQARFDYFSRAIVREAHAAGAKMSK